MFKESLGDYWLDFILINLVFISTAAHRKQKGGAFAGLGWILCLVFCMYAYWDSDYFSFRKWFVRYDGNDDFRDLLYPILHPFALGSYTLFRVYIWGTALLLYYKTARRFGLTANQAAFVFSFFFLLTFSYARASLGMAFYFWGLSYLLVKNGEYNKRLLLCALGFFMAFAAHRSMIVPILLTPAILIPINKKTVIISLCALPVLAGFIHVVFDYIASNGGDNDSMKEVYNSAQGYSNFSLAISFNWKYIVTSQMRNWSFYAAIGFITYACLRAKNCKRQHKPDKPFCQLASYTYCLIYFSTLFFLSAGGSNWGYFIMGYRFLYVSGIPLCILLGLAYREKLLTKSMYAIPIFMYLIYAEGFLLGKILVLGVV